MGCSRLTPLLMLSSVVLNAARVPARLRNVIKDASKIAVGISVTSLDYYPGRIMLSGLLGNGHAFP